MSFSLSSIFSLFLLSIICRKHEPPDYSSSPQKRSIHDEPCSESVNFLAGAVGLGLGGCLGCSCIGGPRHCPGCRFGRAPLPRPRAAARRADIPEEAILAPEQAPDATDLAAELKSIK
ncbi:hypothetical protein LINPERPRIM_LOCUS9114 [Linum perenne]